MPFLQKQNDLSNQMHIKATAWFTITFFISADVCFCKADISSSIKGRETLTELRKSSPERVGKEELHKANKQTPSSIKHSHYLHLHHSNMETGEELWKFFYNFKMQL